MVNETEKERNDSLKKAGLNGMIFLLSYLRDEYEQNDSDIVLTHEDWVREMKQIDLMLGRYDVKTA